MLTFATTYDCQPIITRSRRFIPGGEWPPPAIQTEMSAVIIWRAIKVGPHYSTERNCHHIILRNGTDTFFTECPSNILSFIRIKRAVNYRNIHKTVQNYLLSRTKQWHHSYIKQVICHNKRPRFSCLKVFILCQVNPYTVLLCWILRIYLTPIGCWYISSEFSTSYQFFPQIN